MTKSADIDAWAEARPQRGALRRYLSGSIDETANARPTARERLSLLTSKQLEELTHDVCDVIRARLAVGPDRASALPESPHFHPKRTEARQKLCAMREHHFKDLCGDVYFELGRRYPHLAVS